MNGVMGIVAKIAWAHNRWKGFDREGFMRKSKYLFGYVSETGLAHEWWNFYEGFSENYYFGHVEKKGGLTSFNNGLVIFISKNINDNKFYFVGFYGDGEYSKEGFSTGKTLGDILPDDIKDQLKKAIRDGTIREKFAEDIQKALFESREDIKSEFRARKEFSAVFLKECYVPLVATDLGIKKFGQNNVMYVGKEKHIKPEKIHDLLVKAKNAHEKLLNDPNISSDKKEEAKSIIKKIDWVLNTYFGNSNSGGGYMQKGIVQYLKSQGYHYKPYLVSQFYTALKTKGFVILSGLTGSGKTKIIQELAKLLDPSGKNFLFLSVRPDWRDSKSLLGYYNPLTGQYQKTPLLEFIIDAIRNYVFSKDYLNTHKVWFIRCGEEGEPNKYASTALDNGYISIGWHEIQDMRKLSDQELENITQRKDKAGDRVDPPGQILKFFKEISIGDIILVPLEKNRNSVAIGIVSSDYYYVQDPPDWNPQKHRRKVMWLGTFEIPFRGIPVTVQEIRDDTSFLSKKTLQEKLFSTEAVPYFLLLDEMNLAHVEYYFADFLSVLESGRDGSGFTREAIKLHNSEEIEVFEGIPRELKLPSNLYIIGTVNMDETTYSFSPKVLDRAFTIEFHDVDLDGYPPKFGEVPSESLENLRKTILEDLKGPEGKFLARSKEKINEVAGYLKYDQNNPSRKTKYWEILENLNRALEPYDLHFGYRVVDEIALFFKSAKEAWKKGIVTFESDDEIFDLVLLMKVLPKFHGNRKRLEKPLLIVLKLAKDGKLEGTEYRLETENIFEILFERDKATKKLEAVMEEMKNVDDYKFKHTAKKVLRMLRQLYEIGFASFS